MLGILASLAFGTITWQSVWFMRILRAEFGRVHARFEETNTKIASFREVLETRIDHLDRDVQALMRREFGGDAP